MTTSEPLPVFWMPRARDDRFKQIDFLARHDAETAIRMGDAIAAAALAVGINPDISRVGRIAGAREFAIPDTPFILVYRIEDEAVVVLRILHNKRRWPTAEDAGVQRDTRKRKTLSPQALKAMVKPVSDLQARISKLPRRAQRDIELAVQILREEFAQATAGSSADHVRHGRILKIILFGSYAKGKQVVDPVGRYFSDYDLLVIVDHDALTDASKYWDRAEDQLVDILSERGWPQPLTLIIHTLEDVNHQIRRGRYFWADLARNGIALFEEAGFPLEKPGVLSEEEALEEAHFYYAREFSGIARALAKSRFDRSEAQREPDLEEQKRWRNEAAFDLHQAMERAYYCILLVVTLYQPKSHNLNFLSKRAEQLDERLIGIWKTETKFGKRCYELLRAAYVKARYSPHYKIDDEELDWLSDRITELQILTKTICEERLAR
ncbi:Plasmid stabilization system protein ParE [Sphingobium sp. YR657]|uniref:type II toxin-antitoxin system RelE/ParE family toxin n=1 Tax=Sphingobium sp. YR657 TaxID=1884366 RepID=UPI000923B0B1|nr:type II toxin-antitoxin system RelE/ParE family toxin [Sphingobium sp. YR657]SHL51387.1 Plasmid stabilization system protein ParE [Sphingobium sp. YR657]